MAKTVTIHLKNEEKEIKAVLGAVVSAQPDAVVQSTYPSVNIQGTLSTLVNMFAGGVMAGNLFSYVQGVNNQYRIEGEVNTRLGAMGIFQHICEKK